MDTSPTRDRARGRSGGRTGAIGAADGAPVASVPTAAGAIPGATSRAAASDAETEAEAKAAAPAPARAGRQGRAARTARGGRAAAAGESERRAAIVEIAAGLFAERGYRATTVREIADAAGMLSGSLYHHFDSKESIVDELLSSFLDDLHAQHAAIAAAQAGPSDTIAALVKAAFVAIARHRAAVTVFQNERGYLATLPRFAYLRASEEESQRLWLAALRDGVAAGELRAELDPRLTHRFLRDAIWVSVHWYSPDGPLGPPELAEQFLTTVFDGIRDHSAG